MAILVTGGAGFLGSHLLERLLAETAARLVCLDDFNDFYPPDRKRRNVESLAASERFELVEADLCDAEALMRLFEAFSIGHVFHLAARAGVRPSVEHPLAYQRANVEGTLQLLEAARRYPVQRFLFTSSSTVYGIGCQAPFREDGPLGKPVSPYGVTKRAGELLCLLYHQLHGVPALILRPFSVYGPRLRPDLALWVFAEAIQRGRPLPLLGDGTARRDFTYVSDVVDGLLAAWRSDLAGEVINLGHNEPVEIRRVIALLEKEFGKPAQIERRAAHPGDLPMTCADLEKAERLLGYHPRVPLEEGVREFVRWFQSSGR